MNSIYDLANKLVTWDYTKSLGIRDVVVDPDTDTIALVGPPLKLELNFVKRQTLRNVDFQINTSFANHFGIPIKVEYWERSYKARSVSPMWFHGEGPGGEEGGEHIEDFLSNLEHALRDVLILAGHDVGEETIRVVLLSDPGYPFTPGTTKKNYSAKAKKEYSVSMPPYAMKVKNTDNEETWGVNFCLLLAPICDRSTNAIVGRLPNDDFIVTHSTQMYTDGIKLSDENAELLKGCTGMIFPSLATGVIPATNFGETVLVVKPSVILSSLAPYKKRGSWDISTYETDVWSDTAGAFVSWASAIAWQQLHGGHVNWYYVHHIYVLGPAIKEEGFGGEVARLLTSTRQLGSVIKKKFKKWRRDLDAAEVAHLGDQPSGERYGYLESKMNAILGWDCIPVAVTPQQVADRVAKNLGRFGFSGKVLAVPLDDIMLEAVTTGLKDSKKTEYEKYKYSWIVRDVIMRYAEEHNLILNIQE